MKKFGSDEYHKHDGSIDPNDQVDTSVIRQKDREIWVQLAPGGYHYNLNVTERAAMPQRALAMPAAEQKKTS